MLLNSVATGATLYNSFCLGLIIGFPRVTSRLAHSQHSGFERCGRTSNIDADPPEPRRSLPLVVWALFHILRDAQLVCCIIHSQGLVSERFNNIFQLL